MKKLLGVLLVIIIVFAVVGCSDNGSNVDGQMCLEELLVGRWDFIEKSSEEFSTIPRFVFFPDGQWAISARDVNDRAVVVDDTLIFGEGEDYIDFRLIGDVLYLHYGHSRWETTARRVSSFVDQENGGFPLAGMWISTDEAEEGFVVFFSDGALATGGYGYWRIDSITNNRLYVLEEGNVALEFYFEVTEYTLTIAELPIENTLWDDNTTVTFQRVRN